MEYICPNYTRISVDDGVFSSTQIAALEEMQIFTIEELLVFGQMKHLNKLLADKLTIEISEVISSLSTLKNKAKLSSSFTLFSPIKNESIKSCSYGMLKPAKEHERPDSRSQLKMGEKAFYADVKVSEINHIDKMNPVLSQGERGSCVAFGTVAVREFVCKNQETDLSEQYLYWAAKKRDGDENEEGTYIHSAIESLVEEGICEESDWEYNPAVKETVHQGPPPTKAVKNAEQYKVLKGIPVSGQSVDSMRAILAGNDNLSGRVISFGIPVFDSWYNNPITYRTGKIPMALPGEQYSGGHCMTLVGFYDNESWPGGGYFVFRNSWGTQWARECEYGAGYGTLPYAYIEKYGWDAWTLEVDERHRSFFPWSDTKQKIAYKPLSLLGIALAGVVLLSAFWMLDNASLSKISSETEVDSYLTEVYDGIIDEDNQKMLSNVSNSEIELVKENTDKINSKLSMNKLDFINLPSANGDIKLIEPVRLIKTQEEQLMYFGHKDYADAFAQYVNTIMGIQVFTVDVEGQGRIYSKYWINMKYANQQEKQAYLEKLKSIVGFIPSMH